MSMVNLGRITVSENSLNRARNIVRDKTAEGGKKTAQSVLSSLQQMMPGWNITTNYREWGEGFRNIEIDENMLTNMANDPDVMIKYKALILDLEDAVPELEEWAQHNDVEAMKFGISIDVDGGIRAMGLMRTLLGEEVNTTFDLPTDRLTWSDIIRQKLDAFNAGQVQSADGSRSWVG